MSDPGCPIVSRFLDLAHDRADSPALIGPDGEGVVFVVGGLVAWSLRIDSSGSAGTAA